MQSMPYKPMESLLAQLDLLNKPDWSHPVLDLACGKGDNGLKLVEQAIPVVFADRSSTALEVIKQQISESGLPGRLWQVDLEKDGINPFAGHQFGAIICFRYLHRPLFPALLDAVIPGGMVIYETFTTENRCFGRPNNPDFLLKPGELKTLFKDWQIIFYFEGELQNPDRNVAQLVARKPGLDNTRCDD
jgi:tellurite methyltransferase